MGLYRFDVSLRFHHPNIDPNEITDTLGIAPKNSWRAGEPRITPKGTPLPGIRRETYWYAKVSSGESQTKRLGAALHEILDKLEKHREFLRRIRTECGRVEFFIGWYLKTQAGEEFDQPLLARLVDLQIDLGLDNYYDPDIPDEE